jgi:hypothetical protein
MYAIERRSNGSFRKFTFVFLSKACFLIEFYLKGIIQSARIISINENERTVEIEWFDIEGDIVYVRGRVISYDNVKKPADSA